MFTLDTETVARLDDIRARKGLSSRGQVLDEIITSAWRHTPNAFTIPADGGREEELMNRFDSVAQITSCQADVLIRRLIEASWTRERDNENGHDKNGLLS